LKPGDHTFFFNLKLVLVIAKTLLEPCFNPISFLLASQRKPLTTLLASDFDFDSAHLTSPFHFVVPQVVNTKKHTGV
jgi:hypothetical protein